MDRVVKKVLGYALFFGGLGTGGYWLFQTLQKRDEGQPGTGTETATIADLAVTTQPPHALLSVGTDQQVTATVSWLNPTDRPIVYGVQGAIIQQPPLGLPDLVGGHWWISRQAMLQAMSGTFAQDQLDPAKRVARLTVQPGQRGSVQLYSHPYIAQGEEWLFWVQPNAPGVLLVDDPIGVHKDTLPQASQRIVVGV